MEDLTKLQAAFAALQAAVTNVTTEIAAAVTDIQNLTAELTTANETGDQATIDNLTQDLYDLATKLDTANQALTAAVTPPPATPAP